MIEKSAIQGFKTNQNKKAFISEEILHKIKDIVVQKWGSVDYGWKEHKCL